MRRLCERPGCTGLAESSYGIDQQHLLVWIDNRALGDRELAGQLCRRHADALVVPRGWSIDDRRETVPSLFRVPDADADTEMIDPPAAHGRIRRRSAGDEPGPTLFDGRSDEDEVASVDDGAGVDVPDHDVPDHDVPDAVPLVDESDPEETQAMPWSPRLHGTGGFDDEDDGGPVFGRLLGRAFNRGREDRTD